MTSVPQPSPCDGAACRPTCAQPSDAADTEGAGALADADMMPDEGAIADASVAIALALSAGTSAVSGAGRRPRVYGVPSSRGPLTACVSDCCPGTVSGLAPVIGGEILPTALMDSCARDRRVSARPKTLLIYTAQLCLTQPAAQQLA